MIKYTFFKVVSLTVFIKCTFLLNLPLKILKLYFYFKIYIYCI